jgi:hypothetical protein
VLHVGATATVKSPLGDRDPVQRRFTLDEIMGKQRSIFAMKRKLERDYGKDGLNFPWIDYSGTLRTALPYISKFPRAALDLFPRLREAVEELP